ncbi:MAG: bifunctional phosphoserine phosphatase/homoserine phosphotransferase ThrH [SAR324 cluster bacterium]|nr:bifunctional phosphoserine phosphatase/homoserine phosphotransferase ThrH [SAR324 cluster bacterium]MBF0349984.1 bifunctional phosphoserine phosphatase/homoserine phosphotransferase ThrH [SAR324 cluster bacterium]
MKPTQALQTVTCLDFEGVLIPEIWVGLARRTGIEQLKLTTRDIVDYDELMRLRLKVLDEHNLTLKDIHEVVKTMDPLEGALDFLTWLRQRTEVIILSDTFREFVAPLLAKLGYPTIFCHSLILDDNLKIINYQLRQKDQKRHAVKALKGLNYQVVASGDSYNDLSMLEEAHAGIFFQPTEKITREYPQYPVTRNYEELKARLSEAAGLNH